MIRLLERLFNSTEQEEPEDANEQLLNYSVKKLMVIYNELDEIEKPIIPLIYTSLAFYYDQCFETKNVWFGELIFVYNGHQFQWFNGIEVQAKHHPHNERFIELPINPLMTLEKIDVEVPDLLKGVEYSHNLLMDYIDSFSGMTHANHLYFIIHLIDAIEEHFLISKCRYTEEGYLLEFIPNPKNTDYPLQGTYRLVFDGRTLNNNKDYLNKLRI